MNTSEAGALNGAITANQHQRWGISTDVREGLEQA